MSYVNRLQKFPQEQRQALDLLFKDIYFGSIRVHDHSSNAQGGQLDWDTAFSDAVHTHQSNAEGGTLDHGLALTGLSDDDHTQYLLINGTRAMTGDLILPATNKLFLDTGGDSYLHEVSANRIDIVTGASTALACLTTAVIVGSSHDFTVQSTQKLYLDSGVDTYLSESSANVVDLTVGNSILLRFDTDVYTSSYQDYSATSTIVGWSAFGGAKFLYSKKVGKLAYVWFYLDGTSNATTTTFTLPFTAANVTNAFMDGVIRTMDNGGAVAAGNYQIAPNTSTVLLYPNLVSGAWTNSGRKLVIGQFFYQTT